MKTCPGYAAVLVKLDAIISEQRRIAQLIERRGDARQPGAADNALKASILQATGGKAVTSRQVGALADQLTELAESFDRAFVDSSNAFEVGAWLERMATDPRGPLAVQRTRRGRQGWLWRVAVVGDDCDV